MCIIIMYLFGLMPNILPYLSYSMITIIENLIIKYSKWASVPNELQQIIKHYYLEQYVLLKYFKPVKEIFTNKPRATTHRGFIFLIRYIIVQRYGLYNDIERV